MTSLQACLETNKFMTLSPSGKPIIRNLKKFVNHEKNIVNLANGSTIILNSSHPITEFITESPPNSSTVSSETSKCDMTTYKHRLKSFDVEWKLDFLTPCQMANAGFYYSGKQDRVKCFYCFIEFCDWQRDDDPLVEHKRISPTCRFFSDDQVPDVCGLYEFPTTESNDNGETIKIEHYLYSVGIMQRINAPVFKEFIQFESRLDSFKKCNINIKQNIHSLCEAGLFYSGSGQNDLMLCFYCCQSLGDWEDDDEPWTEHARWSPTCSYVLLSKGKHFVDKACDVKNEIPKINQEELSKMIAADKDVSILENNITDNSVESKLDLLEMTENHQIKISLSGVNVCLSQQDPITIPDTLLCKICYKEEMKVAFFPCGHVIACIQCAMTLDQCAICRQPYNVAMRIFVHLNEQKDKDLNQLPCSSSQCSDEPLDVMLCKVCHEEEMETAFLPCRHVCACLKCATEMNNCLVCSETISATMPLYL